MSKVKINVVFNGARIRQEYEQRSSINSDEINYPLEAWINELKGIVVSHYGKDRCQYLGLGPIADHNYSFIYTIEIDNEITNALELIRIKLLESNLLKDFVVDISISPSSYPSPPESDGRP